MQLAGMAFDEVVLVDFEFRCPDGELPAPICMVARELSTGRVHRLWHEDLQRLDQPPFPHGTNSLLVAYYASAEIGCYLSLGWPTPPHVLDLFTEFRCLTNGHDLPCGSGLLGALTYFGEDALTVHEKTEMRDLAIRGGPFTVDERDALLAYCESDVEALRRLLPHMEERLDLPLALLRGNYMVAAARMERTGIPVDVPILQQIRDQWTNIKDRLIRRVDAQYGVFEDTTFKRERWEQWLRKNGVPWPRLPSGALALDDDTFRELARAYPAVAPIRELRHTLSQLRLSDLAVGSDGRNRCLLSAFRARTGRNQPSNSKFLFGPSVWLRGLIRPEPDWGLAYVDWSQQEFGIAAALSGDRNMIAAYESGDPYMAFAKQSGAAPSDATKESHRGVREQFKQCILGVQYAMGPETLAKRIGQDLAHARELLRLHTATYRRFWQWSDAAVDQAVLHGVLWTVFGWQIHTSPTTNPRSLRNFPMQANGAEMLRLACCLATERNIRVCAPVHDAILIEAPLSQLEVAVEAAQEAMAQASEAVLGGFRLRTDAKVVRHPDRYADERGMVMWGAITEILRELEAVAA